MAKLQKLVVHFRASPGGPSLRAVALISSGRTVRFRIKAQLHGDYLARETTQPDAVANAWAFEPVAVSSQAALRLEVQFPIGFDTVIDPGDFFITAVRVEFAATGSAAAQVQTPSSTALVPSH